MPSPLAAQVADLTRRAGTDVDADDPGLTSRELEVLRLVAAGQSNREIAAALVISPKTASVHVSNILAKLGAATRTEAAVKAHELGCSAPGSAHKARVPLAPRARPPVGPGLGVARNPGEAVSRC